VAHCNAAFATLAAALFSATIANAQALRILATTTDLASLARSVAGDLAHVEGMIPPGADPEAFEPRPSDLAKLRGASVVVRVGLGYDHWLDKLLMTARRCDNQSRRCRLR
jgi:ABC-type Zn uptake system ZnuABC Zn-binding protein ZnuA